MAMIVPDAGNRYPLSPLNRGNCVTLVEIGWKHVCNGTEARIREGRHCEEQRDEPQVLSEDCGDQ